MSIIWFLHYICCRQEKLAIFTKILNYTKFLRLIFVPSYILLTKLIDKFWSDGINILWSGGIETVWHRKSRTNNQEYSQRFFEVYQLFMNSFRCQTVPKPKLLTTWLIQFCVVTYSKLSMSNLAYTTRTNPDNFYQHVNFALVFNNLKSFCFFFYSSSDLLQTRCLVQCHIAWIKFIRLTNTITRFYDILGKSGTKWK